MHPSCCNSFHDFHLNWHVQVISNYCIFLVFFYRLKLLKGWVMGGKHLKEMLKCIVTKILQRSFRWYEIALLLLYLCFLWFCIFLTLTWNLGAVEFSAYFKVLYKLPCATLYRCFPYNCMVDFQSFLGAR